MKINMIISIKLVIIYSINFLLVTTECPTPYSNCNLGKPGFINVHLVPHSHVIIYHILSVLSYFNKGFLE